jgi:hypothetical protein
MLSGDFASIAVVGDVGRYVSEEIEWSFIHFHDNQPVASFCQSCELSFRMLLCGDCRGNKTPTSAQCTVAR